jgi:hypothetical protein
VVTTEEDDPSRRRSSSSPPADGGDGRQRRRHQRRRRPPDAERRPPAPAERLAQKFESAPHVGGPSLTHGGLKRGRGQGRGRFVRSPEVMMRAALHAHRQLWTRSTWLFFAGGTMMGLPEAAVALLCCLEQCSRLRGLWIGRWSSCATFFERRATIGAFNRPFSSVFALGWTMGTPLENCGSSLALL